jgi:replicative DNA helicase
MYTLKQSLNIKGSAGDPLPTVFESLDERGTRLLRGQLCLICAGPGTGKSAFVLTYALKSKVPTLYFSADSDAFTQLSRSAAIIAEWTMEKATTKVREGDLEEISRELGEIPIRFNYRASPSLGQIEDAIQAYDALYEDFPGLIVVDNITNVRGGTGGEEDDDPFSGLESMMDYLHEMARETGACIIGLHHVTGTYNDADKPIPLSGVKGQISRVPEMILTLHRVPAEFGNDSLNVSTVKNRGGKMDASGQDFVRLDFDGDTMQIRDSS